MAVVAAQAVQAADTTTNLLNLAMKKLLAFFALTLLISGAWAAEPTHLFVAGANVRIRSEGNTSGKVVATLPLGTWAEILEIGQEKANLVGTSDFWYKIRDENNNEGWIFGGLTLKCSGQNKYSAALELVRHRLEQYGRPINEAEQLYSFAKKLLAQSKNPEEKGKAELAKLLSFQLILNTLSAMMQGSENTHPAIQENKNDIYYHESAGQHYISPEVFWKLAEKYKPATIADDIAWEATKQQLPGETEGDPTAILAMLGLSEVKYLKTFPQGKYVNQALETITYSLQEMPAGLKGYFSGEFAVYREPFLQELAELVKTVNSCNGEKAKILELVKEVEKAAKN